MLPRDCATSKKAAYNIYHIAKNFSITGQSMEVISILVELKM